MPLDDPTPSASVHVLVRVWLPDRPGALGLVASRIGAVRGDIIGVDVLERGTDVAVDEFAVDLPGPDLVSTLVREIEEVDGVSVEEVRLVGHFPDARLDALESAAALCDAATVEELHAALVAQTNREFLADWTALVNGTRVLAQAGEQAPGPDVLDALVAGTSASSLVSGGVTGPDDLAVAAFADHEAALVAGPGRSSAAPSRTRSAAGARPDRRARLAAPRGLQHAPCPRSPRFGVTRSETRQRS